MAVKTSAKTTNAGIDVQITGPGYIVSPDNKFLEVKKFNLDLQVQVPTSDSAALMKCQLACKAEAMACQKRIAAELAQLLVKVQECKKKEANGNNKAAEVANKEREKSLNSIRELLADSRVEMRRSIAKALRMKSKKEIMTVGRGIFGDKSMRFPKGLFEFVEEPKPDANTKKSVTMIEEDVKEVASSFAGVSKQLDKVVKEFEGWHKAMEEFCNKEWDSAKLPPKELNLKMAAGLIFVKTGGTVRQLTQKVNDFGKVVELQTQELAKLQGQLNKLDQTLKRDDGLKEKPKERKALGADLTKLQGACRQLEKDLNFAIAMAGTARKLATQQSVEEWVSNQRGWIGRVTSLDSRALLHAESIAKRMDADLKGFSKTWKRAWG